jgi:glycerophosphoryl diester phosphodiesterase
MRSSPSATDLLFANPLGFAHRGLHGPGVPENSMAAFRAALEFGSGIECDLRLSSDGEAILFHDPDLVRMCGHAAEIASLRADELRGHSLGGSGECIPALADLLALVSGRVPLLLELKPLPNMDALSTTVAEHLADYTGTLGVMSFSPEVGHWFGEHRPNLPRGLLMENIGENRPGWWVQRADPTFLAMRQDDATAAWVQMERDAGLPVAAWTITDRRQRQALANAADVLIWEGDGRP